MTKTLKELKEEVDRRFKEWEVEFWKRKLREEREHDRR